MSAVAKPPNVLCICIQIHTNTHTKTHTRKHTQTNTQTRAFFYIFFPSSLVTNLATSCSFLIYLQRQAVNSFVVALCLDPQSFSPLFISLYPRDCYSELKANPNPSPLPSQSVSFSQCHRAVKSSQRSLSENFLITTSRSLRVLLHSPPPSLPFHLSVLDLFMENFFYEKYGNYAQLAASQIRIPKTLQCHFWSPRINCITNYASKAKKLNTFSWQKEERERGKEGGGSILDSIW